MRVAFSNTKQTHEKHNIVSYTNNTTLVHSEIFSVGTLSLQL